MKKIMIVDNEPSVQDKLSTIFQKEGFEVSTLPDGHNFIATIRKILPDLLILDIQLGKQNGLQLCKELKSIEDLKHIPVIIVYASVKLKATSTVDHGAECTMIRPFDTSHLIEKAMELMS
ncbi:MAG: response regulator [Chryseobacterium sp.]|nr:MAG: response regulator [Chryseobacterium sp.]